MAFVSNGQRQLMVGHGHLAAFVFALCQFHFKHIGRRKRRRNKLGRVFAVKHHIYFFAAQFIHYAGHTRAMCTYAGPTGIYIRVFAPHRQFGALTGFARNGFNFHCAVKHFGHFHFKHALNQPRVCSAYHYTWATFVHRNIHHIHTHPVTLAQFLVWHLLVAWQNGFVFSNFQRHNPTRQIHTCHHTCHNFVALALHLGVQLATLGLADALTYHMFCCLCCNAPKILGFKHGFHTVAHLQTGPSLLSRFQCHLLIRMLHFFHYILQ